MMPIEFPGCNKWFGKPASMTDEECYGLPAMVAFFDDGSPYVLEMWQPNKEDIEAFVAGRPLLIGFPGSTPCPISPYTLDEEGNPNT